MRVVCGGVQLFFRPGARSAQRHLHDRRRHGVGAGFVVADRQELRAYGVRPCAGRRLDCHAVGQQPCDRFGGCGYGAQQRLQDQQCLAGARYGRAAAGSHRRVRPAAGYADRTGRHQPPLPCDARRVLCPCRRPRQRGGHYGRYDCQRHRPADGRRPQGPFRALVGCIKH